MTHTRTIWGVYPNPQTPISLRTRNKNPYLSFPYFFRFKRGVTQQISPSPPCRSSQIHPSRTLVESSENNERSPQSLLGLKRHGDPRNTFTDPYPTLLSSPELQSYSFSTSQHLLTDVYVYNLPLLFLFSVIVDSQSTTENYRTTMIGDTGNLFTVFPDSFVFSTTDNK